MIEYVRAELLKRLRFHLAALKYTERFERNFRKLEEKRQVERLLHTPRKAA